MSNEIVNNGERKQTHGRVRDLLRKHSIEDSDLTNLKRERFLALLQSRYGYTNDKAVDELERLLKQFYRMNKSLGIRSAGLKINYPPAD